MQTISIRLAETRKIFASRIGLNPLNSGFAKLAYRFAGVFRTENRRAGDDYFRASLDYLLNVFEINATVNLNPDRQAALVNRAPEAAYFVQGGRDEFLPAKARVHRHDEHIINKFEDLIQGVDRSCWINNCPCLSAG